MKTKVSHAQFFALLAQMPGADKEDLVWEYSHTVTNSLSEFYNKNPNGYAQMITDMQRIVDKMKPQTNEQAELKRLRSAILHRLQKHGIDTTDWKRVNAFMRQPRIAGKTLGEMTISELQALIPKLQSILQKDKDHQDYINFLAQHN
jgi:thiamine pyrophosphate-dependent acetolactate synthase large subunit-like protein